MRALVRKAGMLLNLAEQIRKMPEEDRRYFFRQQFTAVEPFRNLALNRARVASGKRMFVVPEGEQRPEAALSDLRSQGYHLFPELVSGSIIDSIKEQLDGIYCRDVYRAPNHWFLLEDAPQDTQLASYRLSELVKIPEVMMLANEPRLLWLAQEYLGCVPTIAGINVWWSFPGRAQAEYSQLYHRDFDDLKLLKLFVYLTDVTRDDGPHVYIAGSAQDKRFRRPSRFTDAQMQSSFAPDRIIEMPGPRGSMFIEDTFGLHKGTMPRLRRRLIFNVIYTVLPIPMNGYRPQKVDRARIPLNLDPYVNRLLIA